MELQLTKKFVCVKLPKALPELNPVERFFKNLESQRQIKVFQTKKEVEDDLEIWIKEWKENPKSVIKL